MTPALPPRPLRALTLAGLLLCASACDDPKATQPPPSAQPAQGAASPDAGAGAKGADVGGAPAAPSQAPPTDGAPEVAKPPAVTRIGAQGQPPKERPDWKGPWEDFDGPDEVQPCFGGEEPGQAVALSDDGGWYTFFEGTVLPCSHHPGFLVLSVEQGKTVQAKFAPYNKRKVQCELFLSTFDGKRLAEDGGPGAVGVSAQVAKTGLHHLSLTCRGAGNTGLFELSIQ